MALVGGPYLWRGLILLVGLALIAMHPIIGMSLLFVIVCWPAIKWIAEVWPAGFFGGLGLRESGALNVFRQAYAPPTCPSPTPRKKSPQRSMFSLAGGPATG